MKILALDASAKSCAAALYEEKLLGEMYLDLGLTHSEKLLPMIDALLEVTDTEKASLSALAVTAGPGSFTGLRIGMATAQGLCRALSIPIAPVPTLLALKEGGSGFPGVVCPMMDARRGEVYTALYRGEEALLPGGPRPLDGAVIRRRNLIFPRVFPGGWGCGTPGGHCKRSGGSGGFCGGGTKSPSGFLGGGGSGKAGPFCSRGPGFHRLYAGIPGGAAAPWNLS